MHTRKHILITRSSFFPCPGETQSHRILVSPSFELLLLTSDVILVHISLWTWYSSIASVRWEVGVVGVIWTLEAEKLGFEKRNQGLGFTFLQASDFLSAKWFSVKIRDDSGKSFWVLALHFWASSLGQEHNSLPLVWKDVDFCRVAFLMVKSGSASRDFSLLEWVYLSNLDLSSLGFS